ncbi:hypothetical protein LTR53_004148 [Teratosphaeriaceae sp. CCFEE 6253]|nr:hypothetical protein LTR53_004148 [Teratosphaeriaceae sp. CCFEE 6253]
MAIIPIQSLSPGDAPPSDVSIRGIITLSWPYSSSTQQCALLIADPDFRLRNQKGQVRVRFKGEAAAAVAKAHAGIGDEIVLQLQGASWVQDGVAAKTPGRSVDGELSFSRRLGLTIARLAGDVTVRVDAPTPPRSPPKATEPVIDSTPLPKSTRDLRWNLDGPGSIPIYSSPAFAKRQRLSSSPFASPAYDFLHGIDGNLEDEQPNKKLRTSFGGVGQWRYAAKSPSPVKRTPSPDADEPAIDEQTPAEHIGATKDVVVDDAGGAAAEQNARHETTPQLENAVPGSKERRDAEAMCLDRPAPPEADASARSQELPAALSKASMPPPPLPRLRMPDQTPILEIADSQQDSQRDQLHADDGPSTPKLQAVPNSALPLPSPFPSDTAQSPFATFQPGQEAQPLERDVAGQTESGPPRHSAQTHSPSASRRGAAGQPEAPEVSRAGQLDVGMRDEGALDDEKRPVPSDDLGSQFVENGGKLQGIQANTTTMHEDRGGQATVAPVHDVPASIERQPQKGPKPTRQASPPRPHTPTKTVSAFGLDGAESTPQPGSAASHTTPQSERDRVMAKTFRSLFGFRRSPPPRSPSPVKEREQSSALLSGHADDGDLEMQDADAEAETVAEDQAEPELHHDLQGSRSVASPEHRCDPNLRYDQDDGEQPRAAAGDAASPPSLDQKTTSVGRTTPVASREEASMSSPSPHRYPFDNSSLPSFSPARLLPSTAEVIELLSSSDAEEANEHAMTEPVEEVHDEPSRDSVDDEAVPEGVQEHESDEDVNMGPPMSFATGQPSLHGAASDAELALQAGDSDKPAGDPTSPQRHTPAVFDPEVVSSPPLIINTDGPGAIDPAEQDSVMIETDDGDTWTRQVDYSGEVGMGHEASDIDTMFTPQGTAQIEQQPEILAALSTKVQETDALTSLPATSLLDELEGDIWAPEATTTAPSDDELHTRANQNSPVESEATPRRSVLPTGPSHITTERPSTAHIRDRPFVHFPPERVVADSETQGSLSTQPTPTGETFDVIRVPRREPAAQEEPEEVGQLVGSLTPPGRFSPQASPVADSPDLPLAASQEPSSGTALTEVIDLVSSSPVQEDGIDVQHGDASTATVHYAGLLQSDAVSTDDIVDAEMLSSPVHTQEDPGSQRDVGIYTQVTTDAATENESEAASNLLAAQTLEFETQMPRAETEHALHPSLPLSPLHSQSQREENFYIPQRSHQETAASAMPPTPQLTQHESDLQMSMAVSMDGSIADTSEVRAQSLTAPALSMSKQTQRLSSGHVVEREELEASQSPTELSPPIEAQAAAVVPIESDHMVEFEAHHEASAEADVFPSSRERLRRDPRDTPARRSLKARLSNVPDVISAWFSPKRSSAGAEQTPSKQRDTRMNGHAEVHDGGPGRLATADSDGLNLHRRLSHGISTSLGFFTPLSRLEEKLNASSQDAIGSGTVDVLAVVTDSAKAPERAKGGPRDYYTIMKITDPSASQGNDIGVEVFRPWKAVLPVAEVGDVVLLRSFVVKSRRRQAYLLSTDASAWCVWRYADAKQGGDGKERPVWARRSLDGKADGTREEIKGPPVELGEEERRRAGELRAWWVAALSRANVTGDADKTEKSPANGFVSVAKL